MRVREPVEPEEPCLLEINPEDGGSPEGGIHSFMLPEPIMEQMAVGISPPNESLRMKADMDVIAQSTPRILPRGTQRFGQVTHRKPKVTFATPFKEREAVRPGPNDITPGGGARRRTIFEDDVLGTKSAWKRTPEKSPEKHTALIGVRGLASILGDRGRSSR